MTAFTRCFRLLPTTLCLISVLAALAPRTGHADAFSEFRIPDHRWSSWTVDLNGFTQKNSREFDFASTELRESRGRLRTLLEAGLEKDDVYALGRMDLAVDASGSEQRDKRIMPFPQSLRDRSGATTEELRLTTQLRVYPAGGLLGIELTADALGGLVQDWREREDQRQPPGTNLEAWDRTDRDVQRFVGFGGATVGIGRVRDATGVYDAYLLEDRLRETGALKGPLSAEVRRQLAELFYVGPKISIVHDRPDKFFWREVERILRDDLAAGSLDAWSIYRARDVRRLPRPIGFFIGPEAGWTQLEVNQSATSEFRARIVDSTGTQEFNGTNSNDFSQSRKFVTVGGRAELHVPLGLRFQLDASSQLRYATEAPKIMYLQSIARGVYLLGDRWYADLFAAHDRVSPDDAAEAGFRSTWQLAWGGSVSYFMEDAWRAEVRLDSARRHGDEFGGGSTVDDRQTRVSIGISYRIAGRLSSPALSEPMTPYRPQIYY
jgi:hypothetical protein